ncbi:SLC13 family permease [Bradyrhizobium sp. USDA 4459]
MSSATRKERFDLTDHASFDAIRRGVGIPLAVGIGLAVWTAGAPEGLSPLGHRALVLFSAVFILYLTEAIPLAITSLVIAPAAVLLGIATPASSLSGFSSSSVYLILGAFILAAAMVKTRLAERITYGILKVAGGTTTRTTLGVTIANIVLAFLIPSSTARTAVLLPVCLGIASVIEGEGRIRFVVSLLLTLAYTNATISAGILTATLPNPVTADFLAEAERPVTYVDWLIYGFPPALIMTFLTLFVVQVVVGTEERHDAPLAGDAIAKRLSEMGRTTPAEWRTLVIFVLVVVGWVTQGWSKLDTTVICLTGAGLLFLPKLGVIDWADANRQISWQVILVSGGGITLGDLLIKTGAADWLAVEIFHGLGLGGAGRVTMLLIVMIVLQLLHVLFVGTTAMATGIIPIVLALAETAQVDPRVLVLPAGMIIGGYPVLMFYNTLPNIMVYGTGRLTVLDFPKVGVPVSLLACIVYAICASTYWRWLGMI